MVGGGAAGTRFSWRLAQAGVDVLCVEGGRPPRGFFETLGASWTARLPREALARPCTERRAYWGSSELAVRPALLDPSGADWFVDRVVLDACLRHVALEAGVRFQAGLVDGVARERGGWLVAAGASTYRARVLVDATGRGAAVSRQLGARRHDFDRLTGHATGWLGPEPAAAATTIVAAPGGWWYAGPAPGGGGTAIFFTDDDLLPAQALAAHLAQRAQEVAATHAWRFAPQVHRFSARSGALERASGEGWLAIGDAAASVDPLSASGISHALAGADLAATAYLAGEQRSYQAELDRQIATFLRDRAAVYGREPRFNALPFWRRRASFPLR